MAPRSSGRPNSGSKGFDFASDDILCSYQDYDNQDNQDSQDSPNGRHSDPTITSGANSSSEEFHKTKIARSPSMFPSYSPPEDSFSQDMTSIVEQTIKKHTDSLLRFLEGISSRMSELELYCYNIDKSIGEMRSDQTRDQKEADTKLKTLEKHLQEVHRSVQILKDKQELAETQKELEKLQIAHKKSSTPIHSQLSEEKVSTPVTDPKKTENTTETNNQQLALAIPHQVAPQQQPMPIPQNMIQQQSYMPSTQLLNSPAPAQFPPGQYFSPEQYRTAQPPTHSQVNSVPPVQTYAQYQQRGQPLPQQVHPQQKPPSVNLQIRGPLPQPYPPEVQPNTIQMPFPGLAQPSSRAETVAYGHGLYGAAGRTAPQLPPSHQTKSPYGTQDGYPAAGSDPSGYVMYENEGGKTHQQSRPAQGGYTPASAALQNQQHPAATNSLGRNTSGYVMYENEGGKSYQHPPQSRPAQGGYSPANTALQYQQRPAATNSLGRNPSHAQFGGNHPHAELIDKLVSMGFSGDHSASVIQRLEESGQPIDFNAVLDRLNVHHSGIPQRGR